jgi:hypothetical protein
MIKWKSVHTLATHKNYQYISERAKMNARELMKQVRNQPSSVLKLKSNHMPRMSSIMVFPGHPLTYFSSLIINGAS